MYPLSNSDEPVRAPPRDSRGIPTLLSPWEYLDDYGIVHPSGCDVCSAYMKHVADASYSPHQPAFQIAFQDRKRARDDVYAKGLAEGLRRQKDDDRDAIERSRLERSHAREELVALRAQLDATRVECERLRQKLHSPSPSPPPALFPQQTIPTPASPQAQLPDCVAARSFAAVLSAGSSEDDPPAEEQPPAPWQLAATKPPKPPKSIKQIQSLIKAAHQPGNHQALTKVKALCSEAHRTPRDQKTEVQRYLLSTWRTPDWDHPSSLPRPPLPLNNPRLEDPVECWVAYYAANPSSCPKGIRRDADGRPFTTDMRASRTVARLRPLVVPNDPDSRDARQKFMAVVTDLFSEPGEYENLLRSGAFSVSPHAAYVPYVGTADSLTKESVARHFAQSGVTIPVADNELGPWAREYIRDVYY